MAPKAKRQKTTINLDIASALSTGTPVGHLLRTLDGSVRNDSDKAAERRDVYKQLHSLDNVDTPYGPLVQTIDFQPDEAKSETVKLEYINPFALMSWLAKCAPAFFRFMKYLLLHCMGNLVIIAMMLTLETEIGQTDGENPLLFIGR